MPLSTLPKLLWPAVTRTSGKRLNGHQRIRQVEERCKHALQGRWKHLADTALAGQRIIVPDDAQSTCRMQFEARVLKAAACHGNPMRAWQTLQGPGLAAANDATWQSAKAKLAPCESTPPSWQPEPVSPDLVSVHMLDKRIKSLRLGRAFDVGGWCHEHIQTL